MRNPYNKSGDILVLINEDCTGRKISKRKVNLQDEDEVMNMLTSLINKYGLNLEITRKENKQRLWTESDEEFKF